MPMSADLQVAIPAANNGKRTDFCFWCNQSIAYKKQRTKDHLVSRPLRRIVELDVESRKLTTPCCQMCNRERSLISSMLANLCSPRNQLFRSTLSKLRNSLEKTRPLIDKYRDRITQKVPLPLQSVLLVELDTLTAIPERYEDAVAFVHTLQTKLVEHRKNEQERRNQNAQLKPDKQRVCFWCDLVEAKGKTTRTKLIRKNTWKFLAPRLNLTREINISVDTCPTCQQKVGHICAFTSLLCRHTEPLNEEMVNGFIEKKKGQTGEAEQIIRKIVITKLKGNVQTAALFELDLIANMPTALTEAFLYCMEIRIASKQADREMQALCQQYCQSDYPDQVGFM
jgi:hypothetical protein